MMKRTIKSGKKKMDVGRILLHYWLIVQISALRQEDIQVRMYSYILMDLKTRRLNPKYRHCEDDGESDGL